MMTGEIVLPDVPNAVSPLVLLNDMSSQGLLTKHPLSLRLSLNDGSEKTGRLTSIMFGSEGDSDMLDWTGKVSCLEISEGAS